MSEIESTNIKDYLTLRIRSRELLEYMGVCTEATASDRVIVDGFLKVFGVSCVNPIENKCCVYTADAFKNCLGDLLGVEAPITSEAVIFELELFSI